MYKMTMYRRINIFFNLLPQSGNHKQVCANTGPILITLSPLKDKNVIDILKYNNYSCNLEHAALLLTAIRAKLLHYARGYRSVSMQAVHKQYQSK